jgi:hypothetical protein
MARTPRMMMGVRMIAKTRITSFFFMGGEFWMDY